MGRPISSRLFGNAVGKIKVSFHNGTAVVDGYIIKQLGSRKFLVGGFAGAAGDSLGALGTYVCTLRQTTGAATAGQCVISATPFGGSATNVKSISTFRVLTVDGVSHRYKLGTAASAAGAATVDALTAVVTNVNDAL